MTQVDPYRFTERDYSPKASDRPDFVTNDRIYISSPSFRALYYERGYDDGYEGLNARHDQGVHPANEAAYEMGWMDGDGDYQSWFANKNK